MAHSGRGKEEIRSVLASRFGYDLARRIDDVRPGYRFDMTCPGSVPEAIIAFLDSDSFEDAVRNAVSLGGDADTQAAIAGGIAEAFYGGVPADILRNVARRLNPAFAEVVVQFYRRFGTAALLGQLEAFGA